MTIAASRKDLSAAAIFVAFGSYFALEALNYELGTPFRMGPGFMPVLLGVLLVTLGLAIALNAARIGPEADGESFPISWRGMGLLLGAIIFFGATFRGLGFVPVVFITALASALASRMNNPFQALVIAVALCVLCLLIFVIGLGLVVPWFGPWLQF